jgi:hypothetical protein
MALLVLGHPTGRCWKVWQLTWCSGWQDKDRSIQIRDTSTPFSCIDIVCTFCKTCKTGQLLRTIQPEQPIYVYSFVQPDASKGIQNMLILYSLSDCALLRMQGSFDRTLLNTFRKLTFCTFGQILTLFRKPVRSSQSDSSHLDYSFFISCSY